jgi:hypothetical protein
MAAKKKPVKKKAPVKVAGAGGNGKQRKKPKSYA